jgi:sterol 3beta-glucosyltransferase
MELPDRLKDHGDQADSEEEVLRPQGYGGGMFMNMNQSIFGLIAAAGSQADFADRFEGQSSDEDESDNPLAKTIASPGGLRAEHSGAQSVALARTTLLPKRGLAGLKTEKHHRKKLSESRLLRSVPGLSRFTDKIKHHKSHKTKAVETQIDNADDESSSPPPTDLAPSIEITRTESRTAPVMSRMLEARAQLSARPSFDLDRLSNEQSQTGESSEAGPTELAKKLKEIFEFERAEEVIEEYPCWLLQHVLLQGYMYITTRHIAFYAYLPKKAVSGHPANPEETDANFARRTRSPSRDTCPSAARGIPSTTATGSASRATSFRTSRTPRISTFLAVRSI